MSSWGFPGTPKMGKWLFLDAQEGRLKAARIRLERAKLRHFEGPAELLAGDPGEPFSIVKSALTREVEDETARSWPDHAAAAAACLELIESYEDRGWTLVGYDIAGSNSSIYHVDNAFIGADLASGSPEIVERIREAARLEKRRKNEAKLRRQLFDAVKASDREEVGRLLALGAPVDESAEGPILTVASAIGDVEVVRRLLEAGAAVDTVDQHQRTALMAAAGVGALDAVRVLVDRGADVDLRCQGDSALSVAASSGEEAVYAFLEPRCNDEVRRHAASRLPDGQRRKKSREALHPRAGHLLWASYRHDVDEMRRLLDLGVPATTRMPDGRTPLHEAGRGGHAEPVELLLAAGAEVDAEDGEGFTPLMRAVASRGHAAVESLVAAGADAERGLEVLDDDASDIEQMLTLLVGP